MTITFDTLIFVNQFRFNTDLYYKFQPDLLHHLETVMKITKRIGLIALFTSLSWAAHAAKPATGFNYNYGQIDYFAGDFDGLGVTGSFEVNDKIFVRASYAGTTNDEGGADVDYTQLSVGAGYHMDIQNDTDAVFTISIVNEEVEIPAILPGVSADETGLMLTAGVRHNLNPDVELAGHIFYIDALDSDVGIYGEGRYKFKDNMSAGLGFTASDYIDGLNLNFRFGF